MSIKLFGIMFLITCAILAPINKHFDWLPTLGNGTDPNGPGVFMLSQDPSGSSHWKYKPEMLGIMDGDGPELPDTTYLWAYLVFTYFFTGLAIYFMTAETRRIIQIRQDYLGSQSTITDRTIRLSGIPLAL